jgi:hypothetical protein
MDCSPSNDFDKRFPYNLHGLDGGTFRRNSIWLRRRMKLTSLTISPSRLPHGATNPADLDVQRALEIVSSMETFQPLRGHFQRLPSYIPLQYLSFEEVNPWFLEDLTQSMLLNANHHLAYLAPTELHLTCGASSLNIPVNGQCAILERYDQAHLTVSYPFDEHFFLSSELYLINCPGFSHSELEVLSRVDRETKDPLVSTNLTYLKLSDCHDFTVQALKDIVIAGAMG